MVSRLLVSAALLLSILIGADARYAPIHTSCPVTALVRPASGLSGQESTFRRQRKQIADENLKGWLSKTNSKFQTKGTLPTVNIPQLSAREIILTTSLLAGIDLQWRRLPSPAHGRWCYPRPRCTRQQYQYQRTLPGSHLPVCSFRGCMVAVLHGRQQLPDNLLSQRESLGAGLPR
jgi:hypothetical protein